ncbi:MAG: 50S ribosomal protein L11 methyltransferase [Candidatus Calescibacterium sp.]|nr:50S ribosomal protein L11 methyltransferase [Candidatus Calescibacterium sp.]MDW8132409.1 50S ribosomal protein L11 methyltransferase [Candidatus Calescibacterium sp.]
MMHRVINICFTNLEISKKLITFLSLINTKLIAFKTFTPPTLTVITDEKYSIFLNKMYSYFFENLKHLDLSIYNTYITQEEYEQMVIDYTEDIETKDFIITPREGNYDKIPIYIRSVNFAEGTGAHPTTRMILDNLRTSVEKLTNKALVIDYGSGSGILSIAVKKILLNSKVISIEINFKSLLEAIQNYKLNQTVIYPCLSNNIQIINFTKIIQKFNTCILIINVPLNVLETSIKYLKKNNFYFDIIILSGIKKPKNEELDSFIQKIDKENFDNYLINYKTEIYTLKDWVMIIGEKIK